MEGSSCSNPGEELPYKSHVHFYAPNIVTTKLSGPDTYDVWKTQILCLLESHDMLGFIRPPQKRVLRKEKGETDEELRSRMQAEWDAQMRDLDALASGKEEVDDHNEDPLWRRSDALVKGWIFGSLSEQALKKVVNLVKNKEKLTSKDVWDLLQTIYGPVNLLQDTDNEREAVGKQEAANDLYKATLRENFNEIEKILSKKIVTLRDKITINDDTALHVAVGTTKNVIFLKKMLDRATQDNQRPLDMRNSEGRTLLHVAAIVGNTEAVKILMERNINSIFDRDKEGQMPLAVALYDNTASQFWKSYYETKLKERDDNKVYKFFLDKISSENYKIVFDFLFNYSNNFLRGGLDTSLMDLAQNFPSKQLNFWERTIPKSLVKYFNLGAKQQSYDVAKDFLKITLNLMKVLKATETSRYNNAILEATRQDAYKFVKITVSEFPNAIWSVNEEGHNFIQYAVINRSENTYSLLYQMSEHKNYYKTIKDRFANNLLHLAGRLSPTNKLDPISGAALQIQRELQWFKEVEGFVSPANKTQKNLFDETPQMVFTREHKNLVTDGENWMKATAESYTITAALIVTIVFAAAITVPGGNNQDNGIPVFTSKTAFTIFAVSEAISFFTSVTSLLVFLSILTARFSEQDFLFKLPTKLIIGLAALFISTTAMLVAFSATLLLVFGHDNSMILIPIAALTCLPIASFVTLQFPLLYDLMSATYGRSIFDKKRNSLIYDLSNAICGCNVLGKKTKTPFY